jgi:NAD(P)H-dependent FMN reductase
VLKNALDFLGTEAAGHPASILSYSTSGHGGALAGPRLRPSLSKAGMLPLPRSLALAPPTACSTRTARRSRPPGPEDPPGQGGDSPAASRRIWRREPSG